MRYKKIKNIYFCDSNKQNSTLKNKKLTDKPVNNNLVFSATAWWLLKLGNFIQITLLCNVIVKWLKLRKNKHESGI